jgi:predicted ArsR family transcriptional regulator
MATKSIRQKIKEQLAEEPMTAEELAMNVGCSLPTVKSTLQKLSADWEVKVDKSFVGKKKPWVLTVPVEPSKNWTFRELIRVWS